MITNNRSISHYLDALVDKDGLKTDVTVTLDDQTLLKIIMGLLLSGVTLMVIAGLLKNVFPNAQLQDIKNEITQIKQTLN